MLKGIVLDRIEIGDLVVIESSTMGYVHVRKAKNSELEIGCVGDEGVPDGTAYTPYANSILHNISDLQERVTAIEGNEEIDETRASVARLNDNNISWNINMLTKRMEKLEKKVHRLYCIPKEG